MKTNITFTIPNRDFVTLKIFDILGREVSVVLARQLSAGTHSYRWNAEGLPGGAYFYRLQAGTVTEVKKLIFFKIERRIMNSKKSIGILAGMGPRSTAPFLELVYDECQKQYEAKYDNDFPKIVVYSWPTPFYFDKEVDQNSLKESVIEGLIDIEKTGVSVIAMPCNTAHAFFEDLKKNINVKLLNIVEETSKIIPPDARRISIMATRTTLSSGIYQKILQNRDVEYIHNDDWQYDVDQLIKMIKSKEDFSEIYYNFTLLLVKMKSCHIDTVICACTDLSVLNGKIYTEIKIIDSSKALAAALIREYLSN